MIKNASNNENWNTRYCFVSLCNVFSLALQLRAFSDHNFPSFHSGWCRFLWIPVQRVFKIRWRSVFPVTSCAVREKMNTSSSKSRFVCILNNHCIICEIINLTVWWLPVCLNGHLWCFEIWAFVLCSDHCFGWNVDGV